MGGPDWPVSYFSLIVPSSLEYNWISVTQSDRLQLPKLRWSQDGVEVELKVEFRKDKKHSNIIPFAQGDGILIRLLSQGQSSRKHLSDCHLSLKPPHRGWVDINLRKHGILPPPGHADCEQVIDRGGLLQAGLASFCLVWKTTDDRLSTWLDKHQAGGHSKLFIWVFFTERKRVKVCLTMDSVMSSSKTASSTTSWGQKQLPGSEEARNSTDNSLYQAHTDLQCFSIDRFHR